MTRRFVIRGEVQGVGFRYFVLSRAQALGIGGWAANLPDGRVEVVASGHPGALDALEASLAEGPRHARVTGVEKLEISDEIDICKSFEIR